MYVPFFLPKSWSRNSGYASGFQKLETIEDIWNLSSLFSSLNSSWWQSYLRERIHCTWTKPKESLIVYQAQDNQKLEKKHQNISEHYRLYLLWNYKQHFCNCWIHQSLSLLFFSVIPVFLCCILQIIVNSLHKEAIYSYDFRQFVRDGRKAESHVRTWHIQKI